MSNEERLDFFKAPERLIELLGPKAAELLGIWFALAGYRNPDGLHFPMFSALNGIKKAASAADGDLVLNLGYEEDEDKQIPEAEVVISLLLADIPGLGDDPCPTISIAICSDLDVDKNMAIEERFSFHGGMWTKG